MAVALALAAAVVAVIALLGELPSSSSAAVPEAPSRQSAPDAAASAAGTDAGPWLGADGEVANDVTVFDDDVPAVANLDPALLDAIRRAATDAERDGVAFVVNSGWRSAAYQERLLADAVAEYGSAAEAARWVATPETSPHVQGDAIDIGATDATAWLSQHGAAYGLCQVYANELWHYELRPDAVVGGCPAMYEDPTQDPRMR